MTRDFLLVKLVTYIENLELVNLLQMLREDLDELMRRNVFNSVYVFVDQSKVLLHSIESIRHSVDRLTLPNYKNVHILGFLNSAIVERIRLGCSTVSNKK